MPLRMTISPMTLYNQDNSIFDDFELPSVPANRYDPVAYADLLRPVQQLFAFDRTGFLSYLMTQPADQLPRAELTPDRRNRRRSAAADNL